MSTNEISEAIDTLDAAMFTGDGFQDPTNRALLAEHIERLQREMKSLASSRAAPPPSPRPANNEHAQSPILLVPDVNVPEAVLPREHPPGHVIQ